MKILKDRMFKIFVVLLSLLTFVPLFYILFIILKNGISVINLEFLTSLPKPPGEYGGGVLNALVGTFILVFFASVIAIPTGIFIGIFLYEYRDKKIGEFFTILVDVLQGIPSIVIGIIAYVWIVRKMRHFSAISGSVALSLIFLPIIIKSTKETLKMLPFSLVEASLSLGVSYPKTVFKVLLPCSFSGLLSGILVGIARISGESAPLLFTAFGNPFLNFNISKPISALPYMIYLYALSPYDNWRKHAWGCSFLLLLFVSILSFIVKLTTQKWQKKI